MAMKLTTENVRIILMNILNDIDHYGLEGKDAEHNASYVAGALDMANAVIHVIKELGSKDVQ